MMMMMQLGKVNREFIRNLSYASYLDQKGSL